MWAPKTWSELESLIGDAEEHAGLDFKRGAPGKPEEVAKDISALTANGGVLLYGVDEDPASQVAAALCPFTIKGVEERFRLIAGTRISPAVSFEVTAIRAPADETQGVVVVTVPASSYAPHQTNGRFPVRSGTVTRDLTEAEVERLYRQRWSLADRPFSVEQAFDRFQLPSGLTAEKARMLTHWLGRLCLVVANAAQLDANHPDYPDYFAALSRARARAAEWVDAHLSTGPVPVLAALSHWTPMGTRGWAAGRVDVPDDGTSDKTACGAVVAYPSSFSFWLSWPLRVGGDSGYCCAEEWRVAAELVAMLAFAGNFLADVPGMGPVGCAIQLSGFEGAVGFSATHGRPDIHVGGMPTAPSDHEEGGVTSVGALISSPDTIARQLLERWLMAFYTGRDLLDTITI